MLSIFLKRWLNKVSQNKPTRRAGYRPNILLLEERIAPVVQYWAGAVGANWSVATNWKLADGTAGTIPGPADTAVFGNFVGIGGNTNSTMNLAPVPGGTQHIGKLDGFRKSGKKVTDVWKKELVDELVNAVPSEFNDKSTLKREIEAGNNTRDFELVGIKK